MVIMVWLSCAPSAPHRKKLFGSILYCHIFIGHISPNVSTHWITVQWLYEDEPYPYSLPCVYVWEEPLSPWPLADLPLPADITLNIASPPVKIVWRTGTSSNQKSNLMQWLGHDYHVHLTDFISSFFFFNDPSGENTIVAGYSKICMYCRKVCSNNSTSVFSMF